MAEDREARLNRAAKLLPALVGAVLENGGITSPELAKLIGASQSATSYAITMAVRAKMIGRHWVGGNTRQVNYWPVEVARFLAAEDDRRRAQAKSRQPLPAADDAALPDALIDGQDDPDFARRSKQVWRPAANFLPYVGDAANSVWAWRGQVKVSA
jgi:hypothetical protein